MNTLLSGLPRLVPADPPLPGAGAGGRGWLALWLRRRATAWHLQQLDGHLLRDIGLSPPAPSRATPAEWR
ncbi:DUF1127 domain-containing protein [Teichococcus oryzae]|nr:DUF1127 domain-containing protein [Pseudoroseomonas oryzae]